MKIFLLFVLALFTCIAPAEAQRRDDYKDSLDFMIDDGEMSPEEMEEEAIGVYNRCATDLNNSKFFDCECIGGAFLTLREKAGPYVSQYDLMNEAYTKNPSCVNDVSIAGDAYTDCIESAKVLRRLETNNEEYCSCVGRETVKAFARNPSLRVRAITGVRTNALVTCMAQFPLSTDSQ